MRTTFQTQQQQAEALDIVPPQAQPAVCARPAFVRPPPPPVKRAKRNVACATQASAPMRIRPEDVPLFLPPVGKSKIHMQYYASNLASVRQVLAQQAISTGIDRRLPPADIIGTTPGTPPYTGPKPGDQGGETHLGDIGYRMYARLVTIAAPTADMHKATVFTHLKTLLEVIKPHVDLALRELEYYKMPRTHDALNLAVAPEPYLALAERAQAGENIDDEFAELLHLGAETFVEALNCCIEEAPVDWRHYPQTPAAVAPEPVAGTIPSHDDGPAPIAAAPIAKVGNKRAKKTTGSRSKR